jgi:hypothetical protein
MSVKSTVASTRSGLGHGRVPVGTRRSLWNGIGLPAGRQRSRPQLYQFCSDDAFSHIPCISHVDRGFSQRVGSTSARGYSGADMSDVYIVRSKLTIIRLPEVALNRHLAHRDMDLPPRCARCFKSPDCPNRAV